MLPDELLFAIMACADLKTCAVVMVCSKNLCARVSSCPSLVRYRRTAAFKVLFSLDNGIAHVVEEFPTKPTRCHIGLKACPIPIIKHSYMSWYPALDRGFFITLGTEHIRMCPRLNDSAIEGFCVKLGLEGAWQEVSREDKDDMLSDVACRAVLALVGSAWINVRCAKWGDDVICHVKSRLRGVLFHALKE